jgi:SAM-dependent methyltransferase
VYVAAVRVNVILIVGVGMMKMTERRLQRSNYPSTFEYHQNRERAPHLEQDWQRGRLFMAAKMLRGVSPKSVVDLGCGDGGLLSLIKDIPSWGYDFCPANQEGWEERGVTAQFADIFNDPDFEPKWGELTVVTEVLEHLADPHRAVEWIAKNSKYVVASSPDNEPSGEHICEDVHEHIWAWDEEGFTRLIGEHFSILNYRRVDWNQIILGKSFYA